jgi:hypothetical protein
VEGYFQTAEVVNDIRYLNKLRTWWCPSSCQEELLRSYFVDSLKTSFFLHIRKGDYVQLGIYRSLIHYYTKAIQLFPDGSNCLIFTEEHGLDKAHSQLVQEFEKKKKIKFIIVPPNQMNEINSLWLMTLCDLGGICANSTFSWWGCVLNKSVNKKCVYPTPWMPHEPSRYKTIYPSDSSTHVLAIDH